MIFRFCKYDIQIRSPIRFIRVDTNPRLIDNEEEFVHVFSQSNVRLTESDLSLRELTKNKTSSMFVTRHRKENDKDLSDAPSK